MFRTILLIAVLVLAAPGIFAQQAPAPKDENPGELPSISLPLELDRVLRDYEQGWQNHDADALATLFAPDGYILRPGHPPVQGREAISDAYRNAGGPLFLRAISYARADSVAYIIGTYRTNNTGADAGKFILTLCLMPDQKWYITADMDNPNRKH